MTTTPEPEEHAVQSTPPQASLGATPRGGEGLDTQAESEARKNTITAIATILAPLLCILALTLGANGLFPLNPYVVAGLLVIIVAGALTAPIYAIKALRYAKRARGTTKGQVGILVIALLGSLGLLGLAALAGVTVLLVTTAFNS